MSDWILQSVVNKPFEECHVSNTQVKNPTRTNTTHTEWRQSVLRQARPVLWLNSASLSQQEVCKVFEKERLVLVGECWCLKQNV